MWSLIATIIPGLLGPITGFFNKWMDTKVALLRAKTGASQEIAVAAINGQTAVQSKWWFAALPPAIIGFTIAFYIVKVVAWDVVIGSLFGCYGVTAPGTCTVFITDALRGDLHWLFITVVVGYFGHSIVDTIMKG